MLEKSTQTHIIDDVFLLLRQLSTFPMKWLILFVRVDRFQKGNLPLASRGILMYPSIQIFRRRLISHKYVHSMVSLKIVVRFLFDCVCVCFYSSTAHYYTLNKSAKESFSIEPHREWNLVHVGYILLSSKFPIYRLSVGTNLRTHRIRL